METVTFRGRRWGISGSTLGRRWKMRVRKSRRMGVRWPHRRHQAQSPTHRPFLRAGVELLEHSP